MNTANAYFFIQVATWTGCMLAYTDYEVRPTFYRVYSFDAANKFLPVIVLIISILLFRRRFDGKQSQKVIANEKIIVVHIILFLSYAVFYSIYLV